MLETQTQLKTTVLASGLTCLLGFLLHRNFIAVSFGDPPQVDTPLPSDFTQRLILRDSSEVRDDITTLLGRVVSIDAEAGRLHQQSRRLIAAGHVPQAHVPTESPLYESKITSGAKASFKGTLVSTFAEAASASTTLEVLIQDVEVARLTDEQVDWDALYAYLEATAWEELESQCLVQGVRLTRIDYRQYYAQDTSRAVSGDAFSLDGTVYSSSDRRTANYAYSIVCQDLGLLKKRLSRVGLSPQTSEQEQVYAVAMLRSTFSGDEVVEGRVSGQALGMSFTLVPE